MRTKMILFGSIYKGDIDFIGNDAFIFPQGRNQTTFSVVIVDNNIYTGPGIVRLFLVTLNGTGSAMYGVEEGRQSAAVEILDNESRKLANAYSVCDVYLPMHVHT